MTLPTFLVVTLTASMLLVGCSSQVDETGGGTTSAATSGAGGAGGGTSTATGSGGEGGSGGVCITADPWQGSQNGANAPECKIPFCEAEPQTFQVTDGTGTKVSASNANGDHEITVTTGNGYSYFSFTSQPACNTADFNAKFSYVNLTVYFSHPTDHSVFEFEPYDDDGAASIEDLKYEGGRLKARLHTTVDHVDQHVLTPDMSCQDSDEGLGCDCLYDKFQPFAVTVDIDVASPWCAD